MAGSSQATSSRAEMVATAVPAPLVTAGSLARKTTLGLPSFSTRISFFGVTPTVPAEAADVVTRQASTAQARRIRIGMGCHRVSRGVNAKNA